jgi:glucokinase
MASDIILGIDIGGTNIKFGLVAETGELTDQGVVSTPQRREPEDVVAVTGQAVRQMLARNGKVEPRGLGLAAPGVVDLAGEHVVRSPNFPTWHDVALRRAMETEFGLPTVLGNDVDVLGLAEHRWGVAAGLKHFMAVAVGTGVGGAIIINGKLYRGATGGAAELGFTVISNDGPEVIGVRGVIEGFVGRHGFDEIVLRHFPTGEVPTPKRVTELTAQGDERARAVHRELAGYLAEAAASWLHILNPEALVLGGGTLQGAEYFRQTFEEQLRARALPTHTARLQILPAKLGYYAGVQGAASLWLAERN